MLDPISEAAKGIVRRNTEEVQGKGDFQVFDELFADDFVDHTTQPGTTPDKAGVRKLYTYLRERFPTFMRRSIGSSQKATGSPHTRLTTVRMRAPFSGSLQHTARFILRPLM